MAVKCWNLQLVKTKLSSGCKMIIWLIILRHDHFVKHSEISYHWLCLPTISLRTHGEPCTKLYAITTLQARFTQFTIALSEYQPSRDI